MVNFQNVFKSFGQNQVLKGIDLNISGGGIIAVLGPNGSGKTTLIKILLGMVIPNSGSIKVIGEDIRKRPHYRNKISYLPQSANFPHNLKVKELIKMIKDLRPTQADDQQLIKQFKLEPFLDKKLVHLSGGTKQKINIVLTFMFDSSILVLDEPTTGLDPLSLIQLKDIIKAEKQKGKTIVITSHIMSFVEEIADEVVFLLEGKIYFKGSIPKLKKSTKQPNLEHAIGTILSNHHA
ncbi:MAG: ABC transporter ATP-binding protein [Flavobacteriaceae bacterium]|jgi:Cu-processing system ATP-binding protein